VVDGNVSDGTLNLTQYIQYKLHSSKVKFAAWATSWRPPGADRLSLRGPRVNCRIWLCAVGDGTINNIIVLCIILIPIIILLSHCRLPYIRGQDCVTLSGCRHSRTFHCMSDCVFRHVPKWLCPVRKRFSNDHRRRRRALSGLDTDAV